MSQAFNHTAVTGQNVFYVNSVSGNDDWTGRYPWRQPTLITGDDIISGSEGPFSTIAAAVRHSQTGNAGGAFNSSVVIVMSDGGTSGEGRVSGDSGQDWTYQTDKCGSSIDINDGSGYNCLIIGGNTGGVIDGTIATIERLGSGICGMGDTSLSAVNIFGDGSSWANLDFYSTGDGSLMFHISGNHTNINNCNFINTGVAISGNADSSVNLNKCSFINCGTTGRPAVTIDNINLYETEFNSTINEVSIQLTGTSKIANIYSSSFINCGTAIDYVNGRCSIVDSVFVSGTGVDINSSHNAVSRKHLISVDNFHYDAVTAYQCEDERSARYIITPLFGNGKFNHIGNSLTTGANTTTGNYTVTGMTHNIMERYANAYRTMGASKSTASEDGYYSSQYVMTSSNIISSRSAILAGNSTYINERTPELKNENSITKRKESFNNERAISFNARNDVGRAMGSVDLDICRRESCFDLMCCCADTPETHCDCGHAEGKGHHQKKTDNLYLRVDGWCCEMDIGDVGYNVGDSCCLSGGSGSGSEGISISVF
jgi:hypothetical protein